MKGNNIKVIDVSADILPLLDGFVFNRLDLISKRPCVFKIESVNQYFYIMGKINEDSVTLGLYMIQLPLQLLKELCHFIFNKYPGVLKVKFRCYPLNPTKIKKTFFKEYTHWSLDLPETEAELNERISGKTRYNIKREKRIVTSELGIYCINHYLSKNVPDSVINDYFRYKKETYDIDFNMGVQEFLQHFLITDVYSLDIGEATRAVLLCCQQSKIAYLENLTYDPRFSEYSLGKILYDEFLKMVVNEHSIKTLYLGIGHQKYKSLYGGTPTPVYSGNIYKKYSLYLKENYKQLFSIKRIKKTIKKIIHKIVFSKNHQKSHR